MEKDAGVGEQSVVQVADDRAALQACLRHGEPTRRAPIPGRSLTPKGVIPPRHPRRSTGPAWPFEGPHRRYRPRTGRRDLSPALHVFLPRRNRGGCQQSLVLGGGEVVDEVLFLGVIDFVLVVVTLIREVYFGEV